MKICNVTKSYGSFKLNLSLNIHEGKIYGLIGANGCGKTTLMKIIAGLTPPDSGEIDTGNLTARDITMVSAKPYLIRDTVLKNLLYPLALRKIKPDPTYVEHFLETIGLWEQRNSYALGLSGGQQQKLALARALIFSPKFVLIDEGFSNLDMEGTGLLEEFILNKQRQNPITYVICAHQLSHIQRLCEYVFFLSDGKLEEEGAANEILISPKSQKLQKYLQFSSFLKLDLS